MIISIMAFLRRFQHPPAEKKQPLPETGQRLKLIQDEYQQRGTSWHPCAFTSQYIG